MRALQVTSFPICALLRIILQILIFLLTPCLPFGIQSMRSKYFSLFYFDLRLCGLWIQLAFRNILLILYQIKFKLTHFLLFSVTVLGRDKDLICNPLLDIYLAPLNLLSAPNISCRWMAQVRCWRRQLLLVHRWVLQPILRLPGLLSLTFKIVGIRHIW